MILTQALMHPGPSIVTVGYGDGAHSLRLQQGATLVDLAYSIEVLSTKHDGGPRSIAVAFGRPSRGHIEQMHLVRFVAHKRHKLGVQTMDKDRLKGAAQKIKGSIKRTIGKLVGNKKLEAEGQIDHAAGTVRKAVGDAKDVARGAVKTNRK